MQRNQDDLGQIPRNRDALQLWLKDPDGDSNQLVRWLQGYDLPNQQEAAYVWLLRALPMGTDRNSYEQMLAERVASLLRLRPDQQPIGRRPNQLLHNGLMLAVGLRSGNVLAEPLWEMFQRKSLSGEWLGAELRTALRAALTHNQIDQRLKTVWLRMSEGEPDDFLGGNEYAGCEGAAMMPDPRSEGRPSAEPLGRALEGLAKRLEGTPQRRVGFRRQLDSVLRYCPSQEGLCNEFIEMADQSDWPDWCIPCLPSLYLPVQPNGEKEVRREYYLWKPYTEILRWLGDDLDFAICRKICRGQVAVVRMGNDAISCFDPISRKTEERRRSHPYGSERSLLGAITDALAEIVRSVQNDERGSTRVRSAHRMAVVEWIGAAVPAPEG